MDSIEINRKGYLERWLAGRLDEPELGTYEAHWFRSDEAFLEIERALAIRTAFWAAETPPSPPAARRRMRHARIHVGDQVLSGSHPLFWAPFVLMGLPD